MDLKSVYETNADFKLYCDKAIANGDAASLEELWEHKIVQNVAEYYVAHPMGT
jgi:hypothetical protein